MWRRLPLQLAALVGIVPAAHADSIKSDERVVFFPTIARVSDSGRFWEIKIHGWIFEPEENDLLRRAALRDLERALPRSTDETTSAIVRKRVGLFLVDNERGKKLSIRICGETVTLNASDKGGHFSQTIRLKKEVVDRSLDGGRLSFHAVTRSSDRRTFPGVVHCLPDEGVSVISDIDDTIKVSNVRDKKELIRNTFFREFVTVDGMATLYSRWAKRGANFHYLSASPWQLYEPLSVQLKKDGFPLGTFHLKRFRLKDSSVLNIFSDPVKYKISAIETLFDASPQRSFILVGDSGEKDPEVYGSIARKFPKQVTHIFIRNVTDESTASTRFTRAFQDVPADRWHVFSDPAKLDGVFE